MTKIENEIQYRSAMQRINELLEVVTNETPTDDVRSVKALIKAEELFGVHFVPVWNKSNREHVIVGTEPGEVRKEADAAVAALGYEGQYFVDADHINLGNVDRFTPPSR